MILTGGPGTGKGIEWWKSAKSSYCKVACDET